MSWTLIVCILIFSLLVTIFNEMLLPTHWIWPTIYYYVHSQIIEHGYLTIIDITNGIEDKKMYNYGDISSSPHATITISDDRYFRHAVLDIDVGLGESFVYNYWDTDDIATYLRLLFVNYKTKTCQQWFGYIQFFSFSQWFEKFNYYNFQHTAFNDAQTIHHHYDWGTSLFESFLDETMTYTAANFDANDLVFDNTHSVEDEEDKILEKAQINKVRRLVNKANIKLNDNVLEIGFGFGYLASYILNNTAASSVTGITLSHDQLEYARNRYIKYSENKNISNILKYLYRDYRYYINGKEKFDSIISVEMIEAIGHDSIDTYFETISNSLKNGGRFVIQYGAFSKWIFPEYYQNSNTYFPTFVQKHIFPAHFEPDEQEIHESALKYGLELVHSEKFGLHYAKTLQIWLNKLIKNKNIIISEFGDDVYRKFKYYLSWSQAVYQTQILHEIQAIFIKSDKQYSIGNNLDQQLITL